MIPKLILLLSPKNLIPKLILQLSLAKNILLSAMEIESYEADDYAEEDGEETLAERLVGLGEMFPDGLRNTAVKVADYAYWTASNTFWLARNAVWIVGTSSMIMLLPYIVEKERCEVEKSQLVQHQQLLLGPSAAFAAANKAGSTG